MAAITRLDTSARYSEAVINNNVVYLAGQVPADGGADMAVPPAKLARYFRELGCSVDSAKGRAELSVLPLRFPKLSKGRAK